MACVAVVGACVCAAAACGGAASSDDDRVVESLEGQGIAVERCELYHEIQQLYRCQLAEAVEWTGGEPESDWCVLFDGEKATLNYPYEIAHEDCQ